MSEIFNSKLAPYMTGLVEQKRALGYKYNEQIKLLRKFDLFCSEQFCQAGIDMIYIRDTLGHTDLATTEVYAKLNIELLRDALEDAYPELPSHGLPDWKEDNSLMAMLDSL